MILELNPLKWLSSNKVKYDPDAAREKFLASIKITPQDAPPQIKVVSIPAKAVGVPMSIFSSIISGLTKADSFLISIFTKTTAIAATVAKLSPTTLAAMLALFYDVMKTVLSADTVIGDVKAGNFSGAFTVSQTTLALLKQVGVDFTSGEAVIVADIQALGIAASTPAPTV